MCLQPLPLTFYSINSFSKFDTLAVEAIALLVTLEFIYSDLTFSLSSDEIQFNQLLKNWYLTCSKPKDGLFLSKLSFLSHLTNRHLVATIILSSAHFLTTLHRLASDSLHSVSLARLLLLPALFYCRSVPILVCFVSLSYLLNLIFLVHIKYLCLILTSQNISLHTFSFLFVIKYLLFQVKAIFACYREKSHFPLFSSLLLLSIYSFFHIKQLSLCSLDCPGILPVDQTVLELTIHLSLPPKWWH